MTVGLVPALTDEQEMLVDASARFMDTEMPLSAIRAAADGGDRGDRDVAGYRAATGELGWYGLLTSEAAGGGSMSGSPLLDAAIVAAELGARLQPGSFAGHSVVVHTLTRVGGPQHEAVLGQLASGQTWATWAFEVAPSCGLEMASDGVRLDGLVPLVAEAASCSHVLVGASGPDGFVQVLVPLDTPGVTVRPVEAFDLTRRWSAVDLEGVALPAAAIVGGSGPSAVSQFARQAQVAAVLVAADAVGAMHADFAVAVQYAKDRTAFGRPIGSFQALKHILADTSLSLEMSKALVAEAARAFDADAADAPELAHAAKAFVAEHSVELMHSCFQVFGGIGFTWEHDQHLYLRRLSADAVMFGSAAWHRSRLFDVVGAAR